MATSMSSNIFSQSKSTLEKQWEASSNPDYENNKNLFYPYSELPYFGQYYLIKIPSKTNLVPHVDYWGEGKVTYLEKVRGFSGSYNVNEQFALVSKGDNEGKKIPNRIPVISTEDCDTSSYIKDNGVKTVTVSTRPINEKCAKDIARIVNASNGIVVAYGYAEDSKDIQNLSRELGKKGLFFGAGYTIPSELRNQTAFSNKKVFVDESSINNHLYSMVTGGDYINAISITRGLIANQGYSVFRDIVKQLTKPGLKNTMAFVYKLWTGDCKDIVTDFFPAEFRLIVDQQQVKIIGKHYNQALKLDANVDSYNDRLTWGDAKDSSSYRVSWQFVSHWENNNIKFKILNTEHNMYLKSDVNVNNDSERKTWGSTDSSEKRHYWNLYPVKFNDIQLFLIENFEYQQGLKLDTTVDYYGDRLVLSDNIKGIDNPEFYGFLIQSWK